MKNIDILPIKNRIETVLPTLNEYQSRRYLSAEAKAILFLSGLYGGKKITRQPKEAAMR